jgi:DNA-binding transcriptional LysR family regulator
VDQRGLQIRPLLSEPRVAVVPSDHRLAGKERISITDLADEHVLQDPSMVPEWRDVATELRSRRPRPATPVMRTVPPSCSPSPAKSTGRPWSRCASAPSVERGEGITGFGRWGIASSSSYKQTVCVMIG